MSKKKNKYYSYIEDGIKYMECSNCGSFVDNVGFEATATLCYRCLTIRSINLWNPNENIKSKSNKPKGWHWMKEFVDKDGNVYHKGKEVPELKGTLSPTKIKKTVKKKVIKKPSYESKIKTLAREYKKKQKLKKDFKRDINR
jgi:hypothetical protein